jgi:plastocyanin
VPRRTNLFAFLVYGLLSVSVQAETIQVTVQNLTFVPAQLNVKVGDTVEWVNKDILVHSATATNGDWDVNLPPNNAGHTVLKKPGDVDYFCKYHPNMKGRISVTP